MLKDLLFYLIIDIRKNRISKMERKIKRIEIKLDIKRRIYRNYLLETKVLIDKRKDGK